MKLSYNTKFLTSVLKLSWWLITVKVPTSCLITPNSWMLLCFALLILLGINFYYLTINLLVQNAIKIYDGVTFTNKIFPFLYKKLFIYTTINTMSLPPYDDFPIIRNVIWILACAFPWSIQTQSLISPAQLHNCPIVPPVGKITFV